MLQLHAGLLEVQVDAFSVAVAFKNVLLMVLLDKVRQQQLLLQKSARVMRVVCKQSVQLDDWFGCCSRQWRQH
jgi:hypothetical protein